MKPALILAIAFVALIVVVLPFACKEKAKVEPVPPPPPEVVTDSMAAERLRLKNWMVGDTLGGEYNRDYVVKKIRYPDRILIKKIEYPHTLFTWGVRDAYRFYGPFWNINLNHRERDSSAIRRFEGRN